MRITVLGASGCGKTCLINSFVNGNCPQRYQSTDGTALYYKKIEIDDEGSYVGTRRPIYIEIEDTPGSEKGAPDQDDDLRIDSGPPEIRKGSRVILTKDRAKLHALFKNKAYRDILHFKNDMDDLCGREFVVRKKFKDGTIGLPSPDGSEGGVWKFPKEAVELKMSLAVPVEKYLSLAEKKPPTFATLGEKRNYMNALQSPMGAYQRRIGPPEMDKSLTRNRMGYMLCFDLSDDGDSLKEAMVVYQMLQKSLKKSATQRLTPIIFLVGCKSDKTSAFASMDKSIKSADNWCRHNEILFVQCSARAFQKVTKVFETMVQAITTRDSLWRLEADEEVLSQGETSGCSIH